jgi:hypothetical protein
MVTLTLRLLYPQEQNLGHRQQKSSQHQNRSGSFEEENTLFLLLRSKPDISKKGSVFFFSALEDRGSTLPRNANEFLPQFTVTLLTRQYFS